MEQAEHNPQLRVTPNTRKTLLHRKTMLFVGLMWGTPSPAAAEVYGEMGVREADEFLIGVGADVVEWGFRWGYAFRSTTDQNIFSNYNENIRHHEISIETPTLLTTALKLAYVYENFENGYPSGGYNLQSNRFGRQYSVVFGRLEKPGSVLVDISYIIPERVRVSGEQASLANNPYWQAEVYETMEELRENARERAWVVCIKMHLGFPLWVFN